MTWRDDVRWSRVGHSLGREVVRRSGAEHAILVIEGTGGRYVQLHADGDGECYAEADSGEFGTGSLTAAQHRRLRELGWSSPDQSELRPGRANYWVRHGPVDVYRLVSFLVATLVEVYHCRPEDVTVEPIGCAQCGAPTE